MSTSPQLPVLVRRVRLWWYPLTLLPILALFYFAFTGAVPPVVGLIAVFLVFFWLFSLGFALYTKFRKPPRLRQ